MPEIFITTPHNLPRLEAADRIKNLLTKLQAEHKEKITDVLQDWGTFSCTFSFNFNYSGFNFPVGGTISVMPGDVMLKGEIPVLASIYKKQIEQTILDHAKQLLA